MDKFINPYDKIAKKWSSLRDKSKLNPYIIKFAALVKEKGLILDIGCGTGYPIDKYLSDQGFRITGIDVSEEMLQIAKNKEITNTKYIVSDFFDFKPLQKYDGIIAYDSLFHFPKEKQKEIYPKVSTWLNDGGILMFTHGKVDTEICSKMFGEEFYYSSIAIEQLKEIMQKCNFEFESIIEDYKDENDERDLIVIARKNK